MIIAAPGQGQNRCQGVWVVVTGFDSNQNPTLQTMTPAGKPMPGPGN